MYKRFVLLSYLVGIFSFGNFFLRICYGITAGSRERRHLWGGTGQIMTLGKVRGYDFTTSEELKNKSVK